MAKHRFRFLSEFATFLVTSKNIFTDIENEDGTGKQESDELIRLITQRGVIAGRVQPFSKMSPERQVNLIKGGYDPNNLMRPEPTDDDSDPANYAYLVRMDMVEPRFRQGETTDTAFMMMPFEKLSTWGVRGSTFVYDDETHTATLFNNRLN